MVDNQLLQLELFMKETYLALFALIKFSWKSITAN